MSAQVPPLSTGTDQEVLGPSAKRQKVSTLNRLSKALEGELEAQLSCFSGTSHPSLSFSIRYGHIHHEDSYGPHEPLCGLSSLEQANYQEQVAHASN